MKMLNILNKEGQTILLVTHDIKVAARGKRVIYIKDGRISEELRFDESHAGKISSGKTSSGEIYRHREKELMDFLEQKGW